MLCALFSPSPASSWVSHVIDDLLRKANSEASSSSQGRPEAEGRVPFRGLRGGGYLI